MNYGNPDKPNKYEIEVSTVIHKCARFINNHVRALGSRSVCHMDNQLYYDNNNQPSRFLEIYLTSNFSIRFGLQRNLPKISKRAKWSCGFNVFVSGKVINEGEFDAKTLPQLNLSLAKILDRYQYTMPPL